MPTKLNPSILIVDDSASLGAVYTGYLSKLPIDVTHVESGKDTFHFLENNVPNLVLLDIQLPDISGLEILKHIISKGMPIAVVIITAHGSTEMAVEAMRLGASDFLTKPFDADRLQVTVANTIKNQQLNQIVEVYKENFNRESYHDFVGSSLSMQSVYNIIDSAAPSKATVFITGESGTGKELCAEAIHKQSTRKANNFVAINCAAIPKDLMESEIFGHIKGAFTGASSDRKGAAATADNGTLFLDEVCEMDLDLQSKLLRFIQTGTYQKVGSNKSEDVNVRFVCATNRDPLKEVQEGRFREDLYYRLHVIPIILPPLRERDSDVLILARSFLEKYAKEEGKEFSRFDKAVESIIQHYDWPGNIRQLQNVIRNIVVLNQNQIVTVSMLPPPLNELDGYQNETMNPRITERDQVSTPPEDEAVHTNLTNNKLIKPLWLVEKEAIDHAIALCNNNIPKAAALLEVSASTIYRKKQSWISQNKAS